MNHENFFLNILLQPLKIIATEREIKQSVFGPQPSLFQSQPIAQQ